MTVETEPGSGATPTRDAARSLPGARPSAGFELPGSTVVERIGAGGMAEVHLADRHTAAGVPVRCVVKTILPKHEGRDAYRQRFLDEARLVAHLRHPNLVSVLDVGLAGERIFLAMEWVDGIDVLALMRKIAERKARLPLKYTVLILREVLAGLHHAHTACGPDGIPLRIVHRDITPSNVLVSRSGGVKLTDFGVAEGSLVQSKTRQDAVVGKLHYIAPEVMRLESASVRSDLWALGVTLYEMLSGHPLFPRRASAAEVRDAVLTFDVEQLLEDDLTVPEGLELVLRRSLARDPRNRYASALEFLEDVDDFMAETGLRVLGPQLGAFVQRVLDPTAGSGRRGLGAP